MGYKILTIFIGGLSAAFLCLLSLTVKNFIIDFSTRNMFGFGGFAIVVYFILPIYFLLLGVLLSAIVININSLQVSLVVSLFISLFVSWKTFFTAFEIYKRPDYFDKTFFYSDVFDICANFIIFPLVAFLIWKAKRHYSFNI